MRLALAHDWLTGYRGGEKCLDVLCRRFPDAPLLTTVHVAGSTSPAIERMDIRTSYLQQIPGATRNHRLLLPLMPAAMRRLRVPDTVDAVVSLSHAVAKGVRVPAGVPHICYCFTPMRYAWNRRGDYFQGAGQAPVSGILGRGHLGRAMTNRMLDSLRSWDRASAAGVTHFVAISRTVARRIHRLYGRDSTIIYPPVDTEFYTPEAAAREDFYLCVSALVPYKRIDLAVQACRQLGRRLIVIGAGPQRRRLEALAGDQVTLLGWTSDEVIRDHLRRCRALLFPAHEDFGIVPLEAAACGAPVLAYGRGGACETVLPATGDTPGTGLLFDEQTPEALAAAMQQFEAEPDRFCPRLARQQAENFATPRFERELVGFVEQVVASAAAR